MQCSATGQTTGLESRCGYRLFLLSNTKRVSWVPHALNLNRKWQWWSTAAESNRIGKRPLLPVNSFFSFSLFFDSKERTHRGGVGDSWQRSVYLFARICRNDSTRRNTKLTKKGACTHPTVPAWQGRMTWRSEKEASSSCELIESDTEVQFPVLHPVLIVLRFGIWCW